MDEESRHQEEEEEQEECHRRQEIIGAMSVIPIDLDFNDGCILLDLAYTIRKQTGYGSRSLAEFSKLLVQDCKTDSNGRITKLDLAVEDINIPDIPEYELPPIVERLQKLKDITVTHCRLIPTELDNLPFLERLCFVDCPEELFNQNMPEGLRLAGLKSITLKSCNFLQPPTVALVTSLVSLEELHFDFGHDEDLKQHILHVLQNEDCSFRHSLQVLDMTCSRILKEEDLEILLFDILPRFPNLHELDFYYNQIDSLQMIASRIIKLRSTDEMVIPENCLRTLNLFWNPVLKKILDGDLKEKEALVTILNAFNEISNPGHHSWGSDVEYLLRINHAGRKFITGGGEGEDEGTTTMAIGNNINNTNNNNSEPSSSPLRMTKRIKPELWPTILERAYEKSDKVNNGMTKCSTGVFYLLRNGSVLEDIIAVRKDSSSIINYQ